jgi:putative ABC transport system permease protein
MRISDYIEQSFSNLWKKKLRTFLTTFGVIIGIGALVAMISFGKGMQKNITERFEELELFNYITVFSQSLDSRGRPTADDEDRTRDEKSQAALNDETMAVIEELKGVEAVFPELRFPARIKFNEKEKFSLIQVLPARVASSKLMGLRLGKSFKTDDENSLIMSDSLLSGFGLKDFSSVLGQEVEISTIAFDLSLFNVLDMSSLLQGDKLPLSRESYALTLVGVSERMGFGAPGPLKSDIFIPPGIADGMKKLPISSLWDLFLSSDETSKYSLITVKVTSPKSIDSVKAEIENMGLSTFAIIDQLEEIRTGFIFMDMFLAAVGMIAIVVASLGIMNTMVMSIMERYSEIGVMKAVGARDWDIKKIFFFESSMIGFLGGIVGLSFGWAVSQVINRIVNFFLAKQGVPYIEYFNFPWWLCVGAVVFSIVVSLVSGIYPTIRAARVDPVVALRHD